MHGGDLDAARKLFPGAPEPFIDLSTGINPHPYPIPPLEPEIFARLPEPTALLALAQCAASAYGAPAKTNVVPAPGGQILMTLLAGLVKPCRAAIMGPTYAEHARAASLAGHEVETVSALEPLGRADLAIVVNPNNPDGTMFGAEELMTVATRLGDRGGLLIVDEAFMDAYARAESLSGVVERANVVVLRSFGKFFGLAGLRLSFALASRSLATRLGAALGPWPVSSPAIRIGMAALSDKDWMAATRRSLAKSASRLDGLLGGAGLQKLGGTSLFSLVHAPDARQLYDRLGHAGILVRRFADQPEWLRFGLPGAEPAWQRLEAALRR